MKVLIPIGSFFPDQSGGPSNSLYWLSKGLVSNGIDVEIVTTSYGINDIVLNQWINLDYGKIIYCKVKLIYFPLRMIVESIRAMRRNDIVMITSIFYPPSILILIVSLIFNKTVILSPRGELYSNSFRTSKNKKKFLIYFFKHFIIKNKNLFFHSTCKEETETIRNTFTIGERVIELPNYMIFDKKHDKNFSKNYLLYLGRIHPDKSLENLILGFSLSKTAKELNVKLKIAGDNANKFGEHLKRIVEENNISDRVDFIGKILGDNKSICYANAYFSFLLSNSENFGNTILEALAQGTPVVASYGTPWEILNAKKAGFWIENSQESIALTIDKILNLDSDEYISYSENAYHLANDNFNVYKNVDKWISCFKEITRLKN